MFLFKVAIACVYNRSTKIYTQINKRGSSYKHLGNWNAARVMPLIAPPVPAMPAKKPEAEPPKYKFALVCFNDLLKFIVKNRARNTKTTFIINSMFFVGRMVVIYAPIITKMIAGTPSLIATSFLIPFLNSAIFDKLLKT